MDKSNLFQRYGTCTIKKGTKLYHQTGYDFAFPRPGTFFSFYAEKAVNPKSCSTNKLYEAVLLQDITLLRSWIPANNRKFCVLTNILQDTTGIEVKDSLNGLKRDRMNFSKFVTALQGLDIDGWVGVIERSNWGEVILCAPSERLEEIISFRKLSENEAEAIKDNERKTLSTLTTTLGTNVTPLSAEQKKIWKAKFDKDAKIYGEDYMWSLYGADYSYYL